MPQKNNRTATDGAKEKLALFGGKPYREKGFAEWPIFSDIEKELLVEVLLSGRWSRANYTNHLKFQYENDSYIGRFEKLFNKYLDTNYGVFVNSGTSALHLVFAALEIDAGSEVITTPYTFFSTVAPLYKYGLKPVFVDVDENGNINADLIKNKISNKTKAILIMHTAGYPCDMQRLKAISIENNLILIQDCAHGLTSFVNNKHVASYGDVSIFSFEASKNLNCGEGGFVATNDEKLFTKMFSIHSCGRPLGGEWRTHINISENYRPTEFQGALAISQFNRVPEQDKTRQQSRKYLDSLFVRHQLIEPVTIRSENLVHSNYSYVVRIKKKYRKRISGKRFAIYMEMEGIPCHSGYQRLIYDIEYSKRFLTDYERSEYKENCPNAEDFIKSTVWIPQSVLLSPLIELNDIKGVLDKINSHLNS